MTLLETERLVRKISELLRQGGSPELAPKLAGDFAAGCHAANLRVQQCEAMIRAGDRPQAIQLAEASPHLLDLLAVLEFPGAEEWRVYCQQNSLPVPDRMDARAVQTLNDCYAQGITTGHPLYAAYRGAVLHRNDEEALQTLRSITRLNPADANAAAELARLDAKVLAVKVEHLAGSLAGVEPALLVAEIEAIEAFGFKQKPDADVWRQAQAVRCEFLLAETARLQSTSRWQEALAKLDFIHRLIEDVKVPLPVAARQQLDTLEAWARGEQAKDEKEREFQSLLSRLHQQIQQSEEKDTSARYVELPELRDDFEALHKVWRSLTDFTRPIPEAAAFSFRKRAALLESEIARRTAIHRRLIVAGAVLVLVIGATLVWLALGRMKAHALTRQLQAAITQRQVRAVDKLLEQAHREKRGEAGVVAAGETFAAREHALLANFDAACDQLPRQFTGEPDAARLAVLAGQLAQAREALEALAPDLKTEREPRLQVYEKKWQGYLTDCGAVVNRLLEQWISAAEKQGGELDYRSPLDQAARQLAALSDGLQKIQDRETGFGKHLSLRGDLLERTAAVRGKYAAYDGELKKIDEGMAAIRKARTFSEYSGGIKLVSSSEFSGAPAALAASAIQSLDLGDETTLQFLLAATNASTWAYLKKPGTAGFIPEVVMPAERKMLQDLESDPAVNAAHRHYRLWLDREGNNKVDWITVDALDDSTGWKKIKAWTRSDSATSASFQDHDYGCFDGLYKLSPAQPVYRLEQLDVPDETAPFHSVGLEKVWPGGETYAKPMLEVLDSLKASPEGSPLFRAWLFLRLAEVMKLQPNAWGWTSCPAARAQEAQIRALVGGSFDSGDWFVPAKVNACAQKLDRFFASVKPVSDARQAQGLLALARSLAKSGLQYAGYVGLDGKPNFTEIVAAGEVFGYSAARRQPVLLPSRIETRLALNEPAMPLSPLFILDRPLHDYLADAGVNPGDASFRGVLPPLFPEPAQP